MDRDQAPRNVGPDLRSILLENQHKVPNLLKTGQFACDYLNYEDYRDFVNIANCPRTFGGHCIPFKN